jgi:hypothetical protein
MLLISTVTVGAGGASNISFTSIPSTYTDLFLMISGRNSAPNTSGVLTLNGSSASFTSRSWWGDGFGNVGSSNFTGGPDFGMSGSGDTANVFSAADFYITNYSNTSVNKFLTGKFGTENNGSSNNMSNSATTWANTAAITSITLTPTGGGSFAQNSIASLYGIIKGSGGATVT